MKKYLLLLFLTCLSLMLYAQKITTTGRITDANGKPIAGVTVKSKASGTATTTNEDGYYNIAVDGNDTLVVSHTGFGMSELAVEGKTTLNASMQQTATEMQ